MNKLRGGADIHTIDIENEYMLDVSLFKETIAHSKAKHSRKGLKWTSLFLTEEQFKAIDSAQKSPQITHLGDVASVDVGIVTGRNSFFVVTDEIKNNFELSEYTVPLVGKTNALKSLSFTKKDFNKFKKENPAYLLRLKEIDEINFNSKLKEYIALGESEDVHKGYKCRIRKRWYDVPSTHVSDGFLFRQIHKYPLLVHNGANATCTDTIHRVRLLDDNIDFKLLSASFVNSLTFAWAEVCGRSYGGGVLELEPNESEELPIPYFPNVSLDFEFVDKCIESGEINRALDYVDEILLIGELGFSKRRVSLLRKGWESLRNRRIMRK